MKQIEADDFIIKRQEAYKLEALARIERRKAKALVIRLEKIALKKKPKVLSIPVKKVAVKKVPVKIKKKEKSENYFKLLAENNKLVNRENKKLQYRLNTEWYRAKDNIWHYENKEKVARIEKESRERKKAKINLVVSK